MCPRAESADLRILLSFQLTVYTLRGRRNAGRGNTNLELTKRRQLKVVAPL